jgi:hypothetical protein
MNDRRWKRLLILGVVFGLLSLPMSGYVIEGCASAGGNSDPVAELEECDGDACAASDNLRKKFNLKNDFWWGLFDPIFNEEIFKVYSHESYISWGYNLTRRTIRWIDKHGPYARCLAPVGNCSSDYSTWTLETCDRDGADTCLFRHENQGRASFTYGVAFNKIMTSCLGTRINWDGSHVRNAWEGQCAGGAPSAAVQAAAVDKSLSLGTGANEVSAARYLTRAQLGTLERACFNGRSAGVSDCEQVALRLYRKLPGDVQRKLRPAACATLSTAALKQLHPGARCERRVHG